MNKKTVSIRTGNKFFWEFTGYLAENGIPRRKVFEDLVILLFGAMNAPDKQNASLHEKYRKSIEQFDSTLKIEKYGRN